MSKKKTEKSQEVESIEWSAQRAVELGLPHSYVSMIDKLLHAVGHHSISVVLCGSWADGTSSERSDIDLLFISDDINGRNVTGSVLKNMLSEIHKPTFDCKTLSLEDLKRLSLGPQHFAIWLMLTKGVVLLGSKPRNMMNLDYERIRTLINDLLNRINDSIVWLDSNSRYTGVSLHVAYIARTLYFIDKYLLKNGHHSELKSEYIQRLLGDSYSSVERVYRDVAVVQNKIGEMESKPRVQSRRDHKFSQEQYHELRDVCVELEKIIHEIGRHLSSIHNLP